MSNHRLGRRPGTRQVPLRLMLVALVAAALGALTVAPAQAASYRFWGFYQLVDGAWTFAQKGPAQITPKDGDVDGWRFSVSGETEARYPRAVLTFEQVCGATPAVAGKKRVGLVVDSGRPADAAAGATPPAPKAVCAVVATDATSMDVLHAAGELRVEKGMVCGVAGYPATDCGGEVKSPSPEAAAADTPVTIAAAGSTPAATAASTPSQAAEDTSSGTSTAAYVIAGLALLAILAFVVARSRAAARRDA